MEFIVSFGTFSIHFKKNHNRKLHQEPRSFSEKSSAVLGIPRLGVERRKSGDMKAGDGDGWKKRKLSVAGEKLLPNFETRITFNLQ